MNFNKNEKKKKIENRFFFRVDFPTECHLIHMLDLQPYLAITT
jgi:hypothetical protein